MACKPVSNRASMLGFLTWILIWKSLVIFFSSLLWRQIMFTSLWIVMQIDFHPHLNCYQLQCPCPCLELRRFFFFVCSIGFLDATRDVASSIELQCSHLYCNGHSSYLDPFSFKQCRHSSCLPLPLLPASSFSRTRLIYLLQITSLSFLHVHLKLLCMYASLINHIELEKHYLPPCHRVWP